MGENNTQSRTPVDILTNRFKINIDGPKTDNQGEGAVGRKEFAVHQYRIEFKDKDATVQMKKDALNAYQDGVFEDAYLFDGGSQLYCTKFFGPTEMQRPTQEGANGQPSPKDDQKGSKLTLTYTKTLDQEDPIYFQIYDLIIKQCLYGIGLKPPGEIFYDSAAEIHLPKLKLRPGYEVSVKPDGNGLLLEVDVIQKVIQSENLLATIQTLKEEHGKGTSGEGLNEFIRNKLKGSEVMSSHDKNSYIISTIQMDVTPKSKVNPDNRKSITYNHYYKGEYQIKMVDMKQPLIKSQITAKSGEGTRKIDEANLFPELLNLTGISVEIRNNVAIMDQLQKHLYLNPAKRMEMIQAFIKRMASTDKVKETLSKWGLSFDSSIMPCIKGEVLSKEVIVFANDKSFPVDEMNDWTKRAMENPMLVTVPLEKWIVITGERDIKLAIDFIATMRRVGGPLGFQIAAPLTIEKLRDVRVVNYGRTIEELAGPNCKYSNVQMVLCVLPNNGSELYDRIKRQLTKVIGIPSQCIVAKSLEKNVISFATKLIIQMNTKLGGEPWKVRLPQELRQNAIVIGYDLAGQSLKTGVVVATINQELTRYYSESFQAWKPEEVNTVLTTAICKSIECYLGTQKTATPPSCVLLYRNNVDEEDIISGEIENDANALQKGLDKWYQDRYGSGVKLVYITIARRFNTRIMSHVGPCDGGSEVQSSQVVNPAPGTIVKKGVVSKDKNYTEFCMVPTAARQGTVRAFHYRVILDNKGISPHVIETFTYKLCHLYFNCTGTVNLPAVCQYADKLAKLTARTINGYNAEEKLLSLLHYL